MYIGLSARGVALIGDGSSAEPTVTIGILIAYILILSILHIIYMLDRDVLYTGLFTIQHIHIVYYCAHTAYIHTYMHLLHTIVPTLYIPYIIYSYTTYAPYIIPPEINAYFSQASLLHVSNSRKKGHGRGRKGYSSSWYTYTCRS